MVLQEIAKRAQLYKFLSKFVACCSPVDERDETSLAISKRKQFGAPKSTYYVSKKFSDTDKWMLEYDATTRNPKWVYEVLRRPNSFSSTEANRKKSKFYADHSIPETLKVRPDDYNNWGYDRGHMAPAADFIQSQEMMDSTFIMVNICPQSPDLNKGFWAKLEGFVRKLLHREFEEVVVITGPVFAPSLVNGRWVYAHSSIGSFPKLVKVPTHFFKIILGRRFLSPQDATGSRANAATQTGGLEYEQVAIAAVLVPNEAVSAEIPLQSHLIGLDQLEVLVGAKFFETGLNDASRKLLDESVPSGRRDLSIILDPVSQAYGSRLAADSKTKSPSRKVKSSNGGSNNRNLESDDDDRKNKLTQAGIVHLCQIVDCNSSLQALVNSINQ